MRKKEFVGVVFAGEFYMNTLERILWIIINVVFVETRFAFFIKESIIVLTVIAIIEVAHNMSWGGRKKLA